MKRLILALTLLCSGLSLAQETGEDTWGAWYMYFGMNQVSDKLSIHSEAQFRYYETQGNFNQMLLRTGLNYHINSDAIATLGYAYILTDNTFEEFSGDRDSRENRIFQQFILKNKVGEFLFEHRYRMEQRFINFGDFTDTQHRARYRLQVTLPLTDTFFVNAYDEIFINLQDDAFGQNRLYFAFGVHITENSSLQVGYLKNHFSGIDFDRLQVALFFNPDLRKKK
ncbi:DUF2490 domain-containing protein [Muriicola marianensis]|uniref:DUF2490 domain-containing protein n=1 Tax=Muriicola marianensis TaxID=1324801 RepID=A0ABQ1R785_9FLAO|nr:DUF2490 domain-containing protein [Muriicola marianensis]GGD58710.1 hypothetical protein GCM10011361_26330 [Muriicola marianensis]